MYVVKALDLNKSRFHLRYLVFLNPLNLHQSLFHAIGDIGVTKFCYVILLLFGINLDMIICCLSVLKRLCQASRLHPWKFSSYVACNIYLVLWK